MTNRVYASMGNYVFSTRTLLRLLHDDAAEPNSSHDFGRDILPKLAGKSEMYAYDFQTNRIPGEPTDSQPYWRDVGTIDAYYEANMDLRAVHPALNLYNREWPLRSTSYPDPPAKFTFDEENRRGQAIDSIVSGGCILSGGMVRNSVLGRGVRVHSGASAGRLRHSRQLRHRPARETAARHSGQERAHSRRRCDRVRPGARPAASPRYRERTGGDRRSAHPSGDRRAGGLSGRHGLLHMEQQVLAWITQYGYIAIFFLLMLGIVGLPVPDETLLTFCGYLIYKGHFAPVLAFGTAFAGSACGITLSYWLGRTFGMKLIHRYGRYVRITEDHVHKAHAWFERVGHWGLTFGYFVPGVRHSRLTLPG